MSNIQREDIGPVELAEALQELLDDASDVRSQAEPAEAIGKDRTWVSAMLRILTLPVHLRERVGTSQLTLRVSGSRDAPGSAAVVAESSAAIHDVGRTVGCNGGLTVRRLACYVPQPCALKRLLAKLHCEEWYGRIFEERRGQAPSEVRLHASACRGRDSRDRSRDWPRGVAAGTDARKLG
ncbi:MAG: ParB/RepB/Spo0J family partition protein [Gemmatimonadaceae bacterium]